MSLLQLRSGKSQGSQGGWQRRQGRVLGVWAEASPCHQVIMVHAQSAGGVG